MSVNQNGQTRSGTVQAWGVNATATVEIELSVPDILVAPAQVWVKAVNIQGLAPFSLTGNVYRGEFHEYFYYWEVRGKPLAPFNAPENMPSEWNDPNVANCQESAFCLTEVGDYIIDLVVIDKDGNTAVAATETITVTDPDVEYPTTATICVSYVNDFTGAPSGSTNVTTLAALKSAVSARGSTPNTRILFKRGEVFDDMILRLEWKKMANYISGFGPSTEKPLLRPPTIKDGVIAGDACIEFNDISTANTIIVTGIKLSSYWDSTSETGLWGLDKLVFIRQNKYFNARFLFHDLDFSNMYTGMTLGQGIRGTTSNRYMVTDCTFTDWKEYGMLLVFGDGDTCGIVGNRIVQHEDALNGGQKTVAMMNQHGPCRVADLTGNYFAMNDLFSRTGWSGADQHCLRAAASALHDQWSCIDRNVMEGGYMMISLEGAVSKTEDLPGNHIVQRNLLVASPTFYGSFVASHRGGTTVRGNYGYIPPVQTWQGGGSEYQMFSFNPNNSQDDNEDAPIACYSNTIAAMRNDTQKGSKTYSPFSISGFTSYVEENNVYHEPNISTPVVGSAPLDLTSDVPDVVLRYKGVRAGFEPVIVTLPEAGIANGATLSVPYADIHQRLTPAPGAGSDQTVDVNGETDTDQAYWQSLAGTDTQHTLAIGGIGYFCAHLGHFTVSFADATNVVITNTSGYTWGIDGTSPSLTAKLKLHRNSKLPAMDTSVAQDGLTVPLAVPANNQSAAWQSAAGQFVMPNKFIDGTARSNPISQGAMTP
ncbi:MULTISPECIES: hypothetical protein [unclassified Octadecabacter]|uniref:hypothetical protein n=1 Tax=unclassified Octadecabacter TaxID=196158 RepID=UPI001C08B193|nr:MULTISPECIES: hypothetical protein [unclassified Octadecabacter]MBU2994055.1 hypothetical protein [Octadecabacter sp. B2R22]